MTKWCGDLWGLGEVVGRRCSALLVLGLGEGEEALGGDFFGAIAFLGALGAARSTRILRMGIFWDYF